MRLNPKVLALRTAVLTVAVLTCAALASAQDLNSRVDPGASPIAMAPEGTAPCTIVVNGTLGSGSPDLPSTSGLQLGRLNRNGVASTCAAPKSCLIFTSSGDRAYDAYTLTNTTQNTSCVTVDLLVLTQASCNLQVNAYLGSYDPQNICTNYLADPGLSSGIPPSPVGPFSFDIGPGETFVLPVHTTNPGEIGCDYVLTINGDICGPVPTMDSKGLAALLVLLLGAGMLVMRRGAARTA